ncbi:glycoprotein-N-acetylgalactosamine 3-beta-galactosyltransferase 1 [Strongylocentrotus purpuratus]|uniref:N-acetylgalactosaminide beta-1,3-galactosyltransferase n=1 Tax=Strongylocentrotus purpuratus TaxID=7668 RepID=A0A7M7SZJ9_STRPU|nr:glycoprotein-N-acetylgalactosamine 3-beta-galactosyltransferase 1 [Strongylocentrotus purpuratus]
MVVSRILSLALGLVAGVMFAIIWSKYEDYSTVLDTKFKSHFRLEDDKEHRIERMTGIQRGQKTNNMSHSGSVQAGIGKEPLKYGVGGNSFYLKFDKPLPNSATGSLKAKEQLELASWEMFDPEHDADKLKSALSVFCVITIGKSSINSFGKSSFQSWTSHCNDFVMLSNTDDEKYNVKNAGLPEGPANSWERTKKVMSYVVSNHPDYDWYVKVEHDTFLVVENFRYMLLMHQSRIQGFAGHVLTSTNQRGSIVALSKEAAVKAVEIFPECGSRYGGMQDFNELEACLKRAGISSSQDGRDGDGVSRFQMVLVKPSLPMNAHQSLDWAWRYIDNPEKMGQEDCCRDYPVSFHNLRPNTLYLMDYMVYHMRPFGIGNYACTAEQKAAEIE